MARLITETWDPQDILLMPAGNFSNSFITSPVVDFPASFQAGNQTRGFIDAPAVSTTFDGFFIYINANLAGADEPFYSLTSGSAVRMYLVRDKLTTLLSLYTGGTFTGTGVDITGSTLRGTGTHTLAQNSHYHIQVGYDSTGTIEIRVDGSTDILAAGLGALGSYTNTNFRSVQLSGTQQFYFDSYYKNDNTGGVDNTWGGVIRMVSQVPIADGFYTAWAKNPSSPTTGYTKINETPYDGDTSTIYSSVNNQKISFDPGAHGLALPDVIKAISTRWVCRKVSTGQVKPFFRISGTDYSMSSAQDIGTDYSVVVDRRTTNPATAAAWQVTDTFEVGVEAIV